MTQEHERVARAGFSEIPHDIAKPHVIFLPGQLHSLEDPSQYEEGYAHDFSIKPEWKIQPAQLEIFLAVPLDDFMHLPNSARDQHVLLDRLFHSLIQEWDMTSTIDAYQEAIREGKLQEAAELYPYANVFSGAASFLARCKEVGTVPVDPNFANITKRIQELGGEQHVLAVLHPLNDALQTALTFATPTGKQPTIYPARQL